MLTGSGLHLNDPYALRGNHIPNDEETAKNDKQATDDTISALVRQAKELLRRTAACSESRAYRTVADLAKAEGIPLEEAARLILARGGSPK